MTDLSKFAREFLERRYVELCEENDRLTDALQLIASHPGKALNHVRGIARHALGVCLTCGYGRQTEVSSLAKCPDSFHVARSGDGQPKQANDDGVHG